MYSKMNWRMELPIWCGKTKKELPFEIPREKFFFALESKEKEKAIGNSFFSFEFEGTSRKVIRRPKIGKQKKDG